MLDDTIVDSRTNYESIDDALSSLSDMDLVRLREASSFYCIPSRYTSDELLNQTFRKVLDGSRTYKKEVNILAFLIEIMRSLASSDCKSQKRKPECRLDPERPKEHDPSTEAPSIGKSPEELIESRENVAIIKESVLKLFDDKPDIKDVVEAIMEEMTRQEIKELMGLDDTGYDTIRKYIRRRLQKAFPEGWKNE